jgi:cell division protein FtsX
MTRGSAFIIGLILAVILLVGYSYFRYGNFIQGFYDFVSLFQQYSIQAGIIFIIGLVLGYLEGKAY